MAQHRHKRETNARRMPRAVVVAGPLAVLATASAVTFGVLATGPAATDVVVARDASPSSAVATATTAPEVVPESAAPEVVPSDPAAARAGTLSLSRSDRTVREPVAKPPTKVESMLKKSAVRKAVAGADTRLWATDALNLWSGPGERAEKLGLIDAGDQVLVTGRDLLGRDEIVVGGASRWVTSGYLVKEKPNVIGGDCTNGTSVPSGVSPNIVKVHEAVCSLFPDISTYGTFRSDGEHAQGIAVDIMVSGSEGYEVAEFVRENYAALGVNYLIYSQQIWSVERSGEGWRGMEDRGSTTANHYDHVHVTVY